MVGKHVVFRALAVNAGCPPEAPSPLLRLRHWLARRIAVGIAFVFALALALPVAAQVRPPLTSSPAALSAALHCPGTFTHPEHEVVLLVHGTGSTPADSWDWGMGEGLQSAGYDVCTVDLPGYALGDIQISTEYVVYAIDQIYTATSRKVDAVGHSQGNLEIRWAVKWWPDLQDKVDDAVYLASPSHGIAEGPLLCLFPCSPATAQMSALLGESSLFLAALNSGDETPGTVAYTSIYSLTDELVLPAWSAITDGAANISLQSICPGRAVTHRGLLYDSLTYRLVVDALSHAGPAVPARLPAGIGKCLELYSPATDAIEATAKTVAAAAAFFSRTSEGPTVESEPPLQPYADE